MSESPPILIIVIAGILIVVLALIALLAWTKQKEGKLEQPIIRNKKAFFTHMDNRTYSSVDSCILYV